MTLGESIQTARKAKGLSQEALAEQVGVSRQALGKWEKDTALPSLDNLQALAAVLDVSVDVLLGTTQADGTPEPALTLETLRTLLEARDAQKRRGMRLWGGAALGAAALLLCVLVGVAWQYDRQVDALQQNYQMMQEQFSRTQSELSAQIEDLQAAVRQGEATVLGWGWQPTGRVVRDLDGTWAPVTVWVTPRTVTDGMTAQLMLTHRGGRYDGTTELVDLTPGADGVYRVPGELIFTAGRLWNFRVPVENGCRYRYQRKFGYGGMYRGNFPPENHLGLFRYQPCVRVPHPEERWSDDADTDPVSRGTGAGLSRLDAGAVGGGGTAAGWRGREPAVEIELTCGGEWESGDRTGSMWSGNFLDAGTEDGWPYEGGIASFVARVTDSGGNVWTDTRPLMEKS